MLINSFLITGWLELCVKLWPNKSPVIQKMDNAIQAKHYAVNNSYMQQNQLQYTICWMLIYPDIHSIIYTLNNKGHVAYHFLPASWGHTFVSKHMINLQTTFLTR